MNFHEYVLRNTPFDGGRNRLYVSLARLMLESFRGLTDEQLANLVADQHNLVVLADNPLSTQQMHNFLDSAPEWSAVIYARAMGRILQMPTGYEEVQIPSVMQRYIGSDHVQILVNKQRHVSAVLLPKSSSTEIFERFAQVAWLAFPHLYQNTKDAEQIALELRDVAAGNLPKRFADVCAELDQRVDLDMLCLMSIAKRILEGDREDQILRANSEISYNHQRIAEYDRNIATCLDTIERLNNQLKVLTEMADVDPTAFLKAMKMREAIKQIWEQGGQLHYWVEAPLKGYSTDDAERHIDRYYRNDPQLQKALRSVLVDEKYTIQMYAEFYIAHFQLEAVRCANERATQRGLFPHPHLCGFGCLGGNRQTINDYVRVGAYEQAIDVTIACSRLVNFCEAAAQNRFYDSVDFVLQHNTSCFLDNETGELFTLKEVIQRENKQEEEQTNGETVDAQ